ncbi:MAG: OmpH family outer membrane protein [Gemmatimonadetes bacterium]|nr:MAG: OmpH family outer membrane protein [Gemmatimonadota bacterium]
MHKFHFIWSVTLLVVLGLGSFAWAEVKIGYINSVEILQNLQERRTAEEQYNQLLADWEKQAKALEKEIEKMKKELESAIMWSEERKAEKQLEIDQKEQELQEFIEDIWGPQGQAYQRNVEFTNPLVEKIVHAVEQIGAEQNYTLILDISESGIVYAIPGIDLTAQVIEFLNKSAIQDAGQLPQQPDQPKDDQPQRKDDFPIKDDTQFNDPGKP